MIRVAIICLLSLLVKGDNMDGQVSLMELNSSLYEAEKYMDKQSMNEDSAIFLGNTRSGRSTLINYLMGNKLKLKQYSKFSPKAIIKADNESLGPEIVAGSVSITSIPKGWTSKIFPNLTLWEAPGFGDNRGAVRDVTNSFYLYRLIKSVKSLKIILVVDIRDIKHDYNQQFVSLLERIENLFGHNFKYYFNSTSIIFTKVSATSRNRVTTDKKYINYHLEKHLLLDTTLDWSEILKNFTRFLLNNNDRIALFKGISFVSEASGNIDADIISVINNSKSIQSNLLQDAQLSISASSMIKLLRAKEIIELEQMVPKLANVLIQALFNETEKLTNSENMLDGKTLNIFKFKLLELKEKLYFLITNESSLYQTIEKMFSIYPTLGSTFDMRKKMMKNIELIQSVESALHIILGKTLKSKIDFILFDLVLKLKAAINNIKLVSNNLPSDKTIYETTTSKYATDVPDVPDSTDAPIEPDSTDAPNVPDLTDAPNVPDSTDAPNVPDLTDAPNVPDSTDAPNVPDSTDAPNVPDLTDAPNVPDSTDVPDLTDTQNVPDSTDAPDSTDVPDLTDAPNVPDSTDAPDSTVDNLTIN